MLADKGEDRHAVSRHMPKYAFMHLLVLGAFRPSLGCSWCCSRWSLNAPSGAGCFLTCEEGWDYDHTKS